MNANQSLYLYFRRVAGNKSFTINYRFNQSMPSIENGIIYWSCWSYFMRSYAFRDDKKSKSLLENQIYYKRIEWLLYITWTL